MSMDQTIEAVGGEILMAIAERWTSARPNGPWECGFMTPRHYDQAVSGAPVARYIVAVAGGDRVKVEVEIWVGTESFASPPMDPARVGEVVRALLVSL